uniref:Connector enhancer of kinase suppressor of ras 2 n=1 Tax=Ascaris suum TaxID=6253 RepID=F1KT75_ASCSU
MNIFNVAPAKSHVVPYYGPPTHFCFASVVESWTVEQVTRWIQGTDDSVLPFLDGIAKSGIDGRALAVLDEDILCSAGVTKLGVRRLILQAVQLLLRFCYAVDTENVQSLCLHVCVSAQHLVNETLACIALRNTTVSKIHLTTVLNSLFAVVSRLVDELKNLMNWLDRSPFDRLKSYIEFRMELMEIALALTSTVNASNKKILSSCLSLNEIANELIMKCDTIVRHSKDPRILYTADIERAVLRRPSNEYEWGFDLQSTYVGVHMISKVKLQSPADACGKIDAGDELLQVNGETVIGWDLGKVVEKIHHPPQIGGGRQGQQEELILMLKKRPRETVPAHMFFFASHKFSPSKDVPQARAPSDANGSPALPADHRTPLPHKTIYPKPKMRQRSVSMSLDQSASICSRLSLMKKALVEGNRMSSWRSYDKESLHGLTTTRRATVCLGTPPSSRRQLNASLFHSAKSTDSVVYSSAEDLTIDIGHCAVSLEHRRHHSAVEDMSGVDVNAMDAVVVRRRRTMRQQPDGYVRSFIDNRLVSDGDVPLGSMNEDEEHPSSDEEEGRNDEDDMHCHEEPLTITSEPKEYALVEAIEDDELESLDLPPVKLEEWSSCLNLSLEAVHEKAMEKYHKHFPHSPSEEDSLSKSSESPLRRAKHGFSFRVRSIFTSSFKSRSHAPIAESEESSLGWESDTADETVRQSVRCSQRSGSPLEGAEVDEASPKEVHSSNALRELSKVPCSKLDGKQYEGWIRRKRLDEEMKSGGKWVRCWMVLRSSVLFVYNNQFAKEADMVVAIAKFFVSDAPELKTSKKYVFRLYRSSTVLYFAAYNLEEMKIWMNRLGLATICYDQSDEERKNSASLSRSMLFIASQEVKSRLELDTSPPSSPKVHHTLPRANILSPSSRRKARVARQASLSSLKSAVSSNLTPPPSSHGFISRSPIFRRHFAKS